MLRGEGGRKGTCGSAKRVSLLYPRSEALPRSLAEYPFAIQRIVNCFFFAEFTGSVKVLGIRFLFRRRRLARCDSSSGG